MPLTDTAVRQAKPKAKPYAIRDFDGLFLFVAQTGTKSWHFRFTWQSKEVRRSLGTFPALTLKEARQRRDELRLLLSKGIDPRRRDGEGGLPGMVTFEKYSRNWLEFKLRKLNASVSKEKKNKGRQGTAVQIERYLRLDILPVLGDKALRHITPADVLAVQRRIEARGALSIAEKVRSWLNEIFRSAVATGEISFNPAADMDIVALPYRRNRHNPYLRMEEMPQLMADLQHMKATRQTKLALRLLLLTGVRTGELRFAEPHQFDLEAGLWRIPAEDVKQLQKHKREKDNKIPDYLVPLPRQAIEIIEELQSYLCLGQRYLLPHKSDLREAISENTLNGALKRMGYQDRLTGHGIRATISTALNELGYNKDWIEAQLSHSDKDPIRKIYNHAQYVEERRKMMQEWADRLDEWEREGVKGQIE